MLRKRTVRFMVPALAALGVSVLLHAQGGANGPARQGQAVVTLANGRMLVTGGLDGQVPTSDAQIVDPSSGTSFPLAAMDQARAYHTESLLADGRVLIAGGGSLEIFDPATNSFTEAGSLVPPRSGQAAAVLADGRVLLAGGFSNGFAIARLDIFDPGTGALVPSGAALTMARGYLSATTLPNGTVLLAGGNDGATDVTRTDIYDPIADTVARGPALALARSGQQGLLSPDGLSVLLTGGRSDNATVVPDELISVGSLVTGGRPATGAGARPAASSTTSGPTVRFGASTLLASPQASSSTSTNEAANLDQCRNGTLTAPVRCIDSAWVNGNAGASNAHWLEGDSIAYRVRFSGLTSGSHTIVIQWDTTQGDKHAIDYVTSFNRTAKDADPCDTNAVTCDPTALTAFPIPADPNTGLGDSQTDGRWGTDVTPPQVFSMYGGTITSVDPYVLTGPYTSSSSTSITIHFTTTIANPVLAWGGHIATRKDWGINASAVAINGSPYHTRLLGLDGASTGNQDRSLSTAAVIFPATIRIYKNLFQADGTTRNTSSTYQFPFTTTSPLLNGAAELPASFGIVDNGTTNYFDLNVLLFGTGNPVSVSEDLANMSSAYAFAGLSCGTPTAGGVPLASTDSVNVGQTTTGTASAQTVSFVVSEAEYVTCTYSNKMQNATLVVKKHVINDNGGSAVAGDFTLHVKSGTTDVAGSPASGSESGTSYALAPGNYFVSENTPPSTYKGSGPVCVSGNTTLTANTDGSYTLSGGQTVTCTITNDDQLGTLIVKKHVINDNGGTLASTDFTIHVKSGGTDLTGGCSPSVTSPTICGAAPGLENGRSFSLTPGTYAVSEDTNSNYTASGPVCLSSAGTSTISGGSVTLATGDTVTCTITNDDKIASPTVNTTPTLVALDSMTLTGLRGGLTSTVTFSLFGAADTTCSSGAIFTVTKTIATTESGNVTVTTTDTHAGTPSGSALLSAAGTYRWKVDFSGNANNTAVPGTCGAESVTISSIVSQ